MQKLFKATSATKNLYSATRWLELNNMEVMHISWKGDIPKILITNPTIEAESQDEKFNYAEIYGCKVAWHKAKEWEAV